jgi:hypothetical protein
VAVAAALVKFVAQSSNVAPHARHTPPNCLEQTFLLSRVTTSGGEKYTSLISPTGPTAHEGAGNGIEQARRCRHLFVQSLCFIVLTLVCWARLPPTGISHGQ